MIRKIQKMLNEFLLSDRINDVYNEDSLKFELGYFLKDKLQNYKIEFERNINMFTEKTSSLKDFTKHEMDIVVYNPKNKEKYAIELKYPRNRAYKKRMQFCLNDIDFIEQLKSELDFKGGFCLTFVDSKTEKGFYDGKYEKNNNYAIFRSNGLIKYNNTHAIKWKDLNENIKYYLLKI